jgi:hypothetical protein
MIRLRHRSNNDVDGFPRVNPERVDDSPFTRNVDDTGKEVELINEVGLWVLILRRLEEPSVASHLEPLKHFRDECLRGKL